MPLKFLRSLMPSPSGEKTLMLLSRELTIMSLIRTVILLSSRSSCVICEYEQNLPQTATLVLRIFFCLIIITSCHFYFD